MDNPDIIFFKKSGLIQVIEVKTSVPLNFPHKRIEMSPDADISPSTMLTKQVYFLSVEYN